MDWQRLFKELIWDGVIQQTVVRAIVEQTLKLLPFLKWGPLPGLVSLGVGWVLNLVYDHLKEFLDMRGIALKKQEHKDAFTKAALRMYTVAQQHGVDSEAYKEARQREKDSLTQLIAFGG